MRITVLLSTYNGEKYLGEQLDSILSQDIRKKAELKLFIRDDGSSDSTSDILKKYKEDYPEKIEYYIGENLKTEKSFRDLIQKAGDSDYYAFSDQDDVWFPFKLRRAVRILQGMGDVPKLYCSMVKTVDADLHPRKSIHDKLNMFTDFPHSLIYSTAQGCTFVFDRELLLRLRAYDMDTCFLEYHDWLCHKVAAMFGKVYFDPVQTMLYRQHDSNVIGMQNGGFEGFIRRVKMFLTGKHDSKRKDCAESLLKVYGRDISSEKKQILKEVAYYTENKNIKYRFLRDSRFYPGGINTLFHLFLILAERI